MKRKLAKKRAVVQRCRVSGRPGAGSPAAGFWRCPAASLVILEACTNLASPLWRPVQTNALVNGTNYFTDAKRTNYAGRFDRVRTPQEAFAKSAHWQLERRASLGRMAKTRFLVPGNARRSDVAEISLTLPADCQFFLRRKSPIIAAGICHGI